MGERHIFKHERRRDINLNITSLRVRQLLRNNPRCTKRGYRGGLLQMQLVGLYTKQRLRTENTDRRQC